MLVVEIAFYFSVFYCLWTCIKRSFSILRYRNTNIDNRDELGFSIIICAHNELVNLKKNIPSILMQNYYQFELIVVLDRSYDGSFEYLESLYKSDHRLKVISINKVPDNFNPKKYGLTKAIENASFEWIMLTDADCKPISNNWTKTYKLCVDSKTDIILGISPYKNNRSFLSQLINYETFKTAYLYLSYSAKGDTYMGVGRNMAYRKSSFMKNNGFHPYEKVTGGDDDLFIQKIATQRNVKLNISQEAITISDPKHSWKDYFSQKTRHLSVGKHYRTSSKLKLTLDAFMDAAMWLSFIILLSFKPDNMTSGLIFAIVLLIKGLISNYTSSNLSIRFTPWLFPILDFVYSVLLPIVSLRSLLIKRVKWN